jgi:hypothetical protein
MDWLNPGRWLLYAAFIGAVLLGYNAWADHQQGIGEARANARWQKATDELKAKASDQLADETAKADKATDELRKFKDAQELKDAQARKTVADLRQRLAALPGGRLRDPNAPGCGGSGGGTQAQDSTGTQPGNQTEPKPEGYFQQSLLNYSNGSTAKPTKSTSPTQPAGQTPAR